MRKIILLLSPEEIEDCYAGEQKFESCYVRQEGLEYLRADCDAGLCAREEARE